MLRPLTGEVKGKVVERTSRFVGVAAEDVGCNEPFDKVVAAFFDNLVVNGLQVHLKGDTDIAEFVCTAAVLCNCLFAKELIADGIRSSPYETIRLRLSLTAEGQGKSRNET